VITSSPAFESSHQLPSNHRICAIVFLSKYAGIERCRGTEGPGVEDVSTPAISNRARRRTQKEVHGSVRTRPMSSRLTTASKTPGVMSVHAWPSPRRPSLATVERGTRQLTDEERTQLATAARYALYAGTPSIKELARGLRISPKAVYDIINRQRLTGSAAALPRTGPAHLLTDADKVVLAELSEELDGEYRWEEMTARFNEKTGKNVSKMAVFRFCKSRGWRERGASLEDAQGVLPCSHSLPRKKSSKSLKCSFFSICILL